MILNMSEERWLLLVVFLFFYLLCECVSVFLSESALSAFSQNTIQRSVKLNFRRRLEFESKYNYLTPA